MNKNEKPTFTQTGPNTRQIDESGWKEASNERND